MSCNTNTSKKKLSVTDQVLLYQSDRCNDNYLPIKKYYDNFRDYWFQKVQDHIDRETFDSEYDFRLCKAVDTFDSKSAKLFAEENNLSLVGMFNRWFYRILSNWHINVRSATFRVNKRPSIQCPVCGRFVLKIDEEHLQHYKTMRDLPKVFVYDNHIYRTVTSASQYAVCWGKYNANKFYNLNNGYRSQYTSDRILIDWPFFNERGDKMVVCPLTGNKVPFITNEYIRSLDKMYNRYAPNLSWFEFDEKYPSVLIQSEIFSLGDGSGVDEMLFRNKTSNDCNKHDVNHENLDDVRNSVEYEHVFKVIESHVNDEVDRTIMKLLSVGYSVQEIEKSIHISKKEIRDRVKQAKKNRSMMNMLCV